MERRSLLRRAAAVACALGLVAAAVILQGQRDGSPAALFEAAMYGPAGLEHPHNVFSFARPAQARISRAAQHQVQAHLCFGSDCADVPPAFAQALIRTEKEEYAQAFRAGQAASRPAGRSKGEVIPGFQPMRVASLSDGIHRHEAEVLAGPPPPAWHSQWEKIFGQHGR